MTVLVSRTPQGWAVDCLDCYGGAGGPLDLGHWTLKREADDAAKIHRAEHRETDRRYDRELLIASLSWWSGWCTDNDRALPQLANLGSLLLDAKHRIALDRDPICPSKGDPE